MFTANAQRWYEVKAKRNRTTIPSMAKLVSLRTKPRFACALCIKQKATADIATETTWMLYEMKQHMTLENTARSMSPL
jgi:hypothetical protein